jgi:hypothetical protein
MTAEFTADGLQAVARETTATAPVLEPVAVESVTLSTWAPVPLEAAVAGEQSEAAPSMLERSDGRCLLYGSRVHALHAEPEALKTWLALVASVEQIATGRVVIYIDFEDGPAGIVQRLRELGADSQAILTRFVYIRPDEPLTGAVAHDLDTALARKPSLVVIDGVTEAFSRQGLNPLDNSDVATWLDLLPRRCVRAGAATLTLDHVVKDREQRGRYAIGAQHKLAGVDVAYSLKVIEPFAHGRDGLVAVKVEKDRPGRVREFASDGQVALIRARSHSNGSVTITLEPPDRQDGPAAAFRPTVLMERVSRAVEATPGLTKSAIREAVRGKAGQIDLARETLISEGCIDARHDGPQAVRHYSIKPFDPSDDTHPVPSSQPGPNPVPDRVAVDPVPQSRPIRTGDGGHGHQDSPQNGHPVPTCCCADGGDEPTPDGTCTRCWGQIETEPETPPDERAERCAPTRGDS